jgi:pimeloyl-ACP methyl ester carboxylesterase
MLIAFRHAYTKIRWNHWLLGLAVGVIGIFQWVGMQLFLQKHFEFFKPDTKAFNPDLFFSDPTMRWAFIGVRLLGAVIVVPVMEELFWRDFLWRQILAPNDFKLARVGEWGWAPYLIDQGYVVYMVDYPARGRSPYVPGVDGNLGIRTATELSQIWTGPVLSGGNFPRMNKYTQWPSNSPKKGTMGDPVFDNFIKGQMQFVNDQAALAVPAGIALLDAIGKPVILLTHSQGGGIGFDVAEQRSQFIAGMVSIEPGGPQIGTVDTAKVTYTRTNPNSWGLTTNKYEFDPPISSPAELKTHLEPSERPGDEVGCYMQDAPVHKLVHFQNMRILSISAEGTYHRVFDVCIPKWLNQAGAKDDFVRLEDVGIHGNMHEMFLDRNSDEVIKFIDTWLRKNINTKTASGTR